MVERFIPQEKDSNVNQGWENSPEGERVFNKFQQWVRKKFPNEYSPEDILNRIPEEAFERKCKLTCMFFNDPDQYSKLNLTPEGKDAVFGIVRTAGQYLETKPLRLLLQQSL